MKSIASLLLLIAVLAGTAAPAFAQSTPPGDAWGEVVNGDGTMRHDNLTDLGVVTVDADWMPNIPGVGPVPAEFHQYLTPSGNIVMAPTLSTYVFMLANADQSGLLEAASTLNFSEATTNVSTSSLITLLITGSFGENSLQVTDGALFEKIASGSNNVWSLFPGGDGLNFINALFRMSVEDRSIYTHLLLYTPGQCARLPGGCPPALLALINPPPGTQPPPPVCNPGEVVQGRISVSAMQLAPAYVLVVGQDPEKRGADVSWTIRVEPTIHRTWDMVEEKECRVGPGLGGPADFSCRTTGTPANRPYNGHYVVTGYTCEPTERVYCETLSRASVFARLSPRSRDWILNELSVRYPGAYLRNPDFAFTGNPSLGGCSGGTMTWTYTRPNIQFADPGWFDLSASGITSGTPVSPPRPFTLPGGRVDVYLKEIVIIQ